MLPAHPAGLEQKFQTNVTSPETQQQSGPALLFPMRVYLLLTAILPIFAVAPLFYPGYIQTHSGFIPLWNVVDLRTNLGDLGWTPQIATTFDPLRGDGLLPYYLASLLPLSPIAAIKLIFGLSWLLGSVGMFLWLKSWLGHPGALIAALVYTYLPHQIVTVYVRGAWGEALFWGLLPWVILSTTYLVTSPKLRILPIAALFWLGSGLSQLGLTLWALIFILLLLLVVHRSQALLPILAALLGTIATIIVYILLPPHTLFIFTPTSFGDHFLFLFQLVSAFWGFGPSLPGWNDGLSFQIGLAAVGLSILSLFLWWRGGAEHLRPVNRTDRRLVFFFGAALVLILLQFSLTSFLWEFPLLLGHPLSNTLTYPWQLLGFIGLCLSVLAGVALWLDRQLTHLPIFGSIIIVIILSVYPYLLPQFVQVDSNLIEYPKAGLGDGQLALLAYDFSVATSGYTVGLDRGETTIPLAVHGPLKAGDTLMMNVTWQPLQRFDNDLKVFVHLVDANDNVLAQFDGQPLEGTHPTSQWIPGEIIDDTYPLLVPPDATPGPYRVFIGLYDEATLERLPVSTDSAGRVILDVQ